MSEMVSAVYSYNLDLILIDAIERINLHLQGVELQSY